MPGASFPQPVTEVVATLSELFRHQSRREMVELLESAHAYFEEVNYDNWNGGTYTWALRLEIPVQLFAALEPQLSAVENEISGKLNYFSRTFSNHQLGEVTIAPIAPGGSPVGQRWAPSELDVRRIWKPRRFRLFLSHLSTHKGIASTLKTALLLRGVDTFVAHEDIEPSLEWQSEIEIALRSMHALAAMLTTAFHGSNWTDQEVGWALGRGILVVPLRFGIDPYGLMGKFQGVAGTLQHPKKAAARLSDVLLSNRQTHGEMRRSVITSFAEASSPEMVKALYPLIRKLTDLTDEEREVIWRGCSENVHVRNTESVTSAIYADIGRPALQSAPSSEVDDIPF